MLFLFLISLAFGWTLVFDLSQSTVSLNALHTMESQIALIRKIVWGDSIVCLWHGSDLGDTLFKHWLTAYDRQVVVRAFLYNFYNPPPHSSSCNSSLFPLHQNGRLNPASPALLWPYSTLRWSHQNGCLPSLASCVTQRCAILEGTERRGVCNYIFPIWTKPVGL